MQRILTAICVTLILGGCTSSSRDLKPVQLSFSNIVDPSEGKVQIDFGESYRNDQVQLFVNGERVFSKTISTPDNGTGFTDSVAVKVPITEQHLELRLVVNGEEWKSRINLGEGHFLCIEWNQRNQKKPEIKQARCQIPYD